MKSAYCWSTETPLATNSETMADYLEFEMDQSWEVLHVDGTYAEIMTDCGEHYAANASGCGDFFNHKVEFEPL